MGKEHAFDRLLDDHFERTGEDLRAMSPDEICDLPPIEGLRHAEHNRHGLRYITPEEAAENYRKSEEFLRRPRLEFSEGEDLKPIRKRFSGLIDVVLRRS